MTKEELRKEWEERVADFRASGQSGLAWCTVHDLKPHQLWYWIRKFKKTNTPTLKPSQWMPVEVTEPESSSFQGSSFLVRVGQATIEVKPGFNPQMFSEVVRILAALW